MQSMTKTLSQCGKSLYHLLGNRRRYERQEWTCTLTTTHRDKYGQLITYECRCLDISARGMGIECPEPITRNADVFVQSEQRNLRSFAKVRHCEPRASGYFIGLEFRAEPDYWITHT